MIMMPKKMNHEKLFDWLQEYYKFEYQDIGEDVKVRTINFVIQNNAQLFSAKTVIDFDACSRCGICCKLQHCIYYNDEEKKCTNHTDVRFEVCKTYPWAGEYGLDLTVNCKYVRLLLIDYLNQVFDTMENKNEE